MLKRPHTQSQNRKVCSESMPNSSAAEGCTVTPAKCFCQSPVPNFFLHKSLKTCAFDKVSLVEKLLETTTNKVSSSEISWSNCSICWASILMINCSRKFDCL